MGIFGYKPIDERIKWDTPEQIKDALRWRHQIIFTDFDYETCLVEDLLCEANNNERWRTSKFLAEFKYDNVENFRCTDAELVTTGCKDIIQARKDGADKKDIHEWVRITSDIANLLRKHNEPILSNHYGFWWGRCNKVSIYKDPMIGQIAEDLDYKLGFGNRG